jgi:Ca2+/Na+ antiporter
MVYLKKILDFTICIGIASVFSRFYHKEDIPLSMKSILRDIYSYLLSLVFVIYICWDYKVTTFEAISLISLYPLYLWAHYILGKREQNENNTKKSLIKDSLPWRKYYGILDYKENYIARIKNNNGDNHFITIIQIIFFFYRSGRGRKRFNIGHFIQRIYKI